MQEQVVERPDVAAAVCETLGEEVVGAGVAERRDLRCDHNHERDPDYQRGERDTRARTEIAASGISLAHGRDGRVPAHSRPVVSAFDAVARFGGGVEHSSREDWGLAAGGAVSSPAVCSWYSSSTFTDQMS